MKVNLWKNTHSEKIYEMPMDWLPKFSGWELIGINKKRGSAKKVEKNKKS